MNENLENGNQRQNWITDLVAILRSKKFLTIVGVLIGLVVLREGVNWYISLSTKAKIPTVRVVYPEVKSLDSNMTLPGNMEAIEQASIYAHVSGYLKKIYVDEGDRVKKNQVLAEIDAPDVVDDYNTLKADLNLKTVTRKRYKELLDEQVISQQEFDNIDASYDETKAKFDNASTNMEYTKIRAPFDGSIARRFQYPGDFISVASHGDQTPIFLVINEQTLRVVVDVPQVEVAHVKLGDPVDIKVDSFADEIFQGTVTRLDALLDPSTKTQRVLIDIENKDKKLRAGMFASVVLHFAHKDNAITVPLDVVETEGDKNFVYVLDHNKAKKIAVTLGTKETNDIEVITGLKPQDLIIRKGLMTLSDGMTVAATKIPSAPPTTATAQSAAAEPAPASEPATTSESESRVAQPAPSQATPAKMQPGRDTQPGTGTEMRPTTDSIQKESAKNG